VLKVQINRVARLQIAKPIGPFDEADGAFKRLIQSKFDHFERVAQTVQITVPNVPIRVVIGLDQRKRWGGHFDQLPKPMLDKTPREGRLPSP